MEPSSALPPLFTLSSAVFVEREDKILILKRAGGEATGGWYLPGGAVDPGETVEHCAARELMEEAGLPPDGQLTCVAVAHMQVYGYPSLQVLYACGSANGDVVLSAEHSAARWIDPAAYRERYFSDDIIRQVATSSPRVAEMLANIRHALDAYLKWREMRALAMERTHLPFTTG